MTSADFQPEGVVNNVDGGGNEVPRDSDPHPVFYFGGRVGCHQRAKILTDLAPRSYVVHPDYGMAQSHTSGGDEPFVMTS